MNTHALGNFVKLLVPARLRSPLRAAFNWRGHMEFVKARLQGRAASYERHDAQYRDPDALARAVEVTRERDDCDAANSRELNLGTLIDLHPQLRIAVDIGSGIGWLSGWLATRFDKVISIEPSASAVAIARDIQRHHADRIEWRVGLADGALGMLVLPAPALFVTGRVLSHLSDREVRKILDSVDRIAPKGSLMVLAELWGETHHAWMWHIRSKDWWREAAGSRWQVEFLDNPIEASGRFVGLRATCVGE